LPETSTRSNSNLDADATVWSNVPGHTAESGADGFMTDTDQVGNVEFKIYRVQCTD
jgi:hypothetical protein